MSHVELTDACPYLYRTCYQSQIRRTISTNRQLGRKRTRPASIDGDFLSLEFDKLTLSDSQNVNKGKQSDFFTRENNLSHYSKPSTNKSDTLSKETKVVM